MSRLYLDHQCCGKTWLPTELWSKEPCLSAPGVTDKMLLHASLTTATLKPRCFSSFIPQALNSCLLVSFCSVTGLFAGAVGQSVTKNSQAEGQDATFIEKIYTYLHYPETFTIKGYLQLYASSRTQAIGDDLTWDIITIELTRTTEALAHHENWSELHHFKASQPSLRLLLWHPRGTSISNAVLEYRIILPITHTLANIQAIE